MQQHMFRQPGLMILIVCVTAGWTLSAQELPDLQVTSPRIDLSAPAAALAPDPELLANLPRAVGEDTDWGGPGCPTVAELRALVDGFLATPHPAFPGLGSTVPGMSASWSSDDCGTFTYAAGLRDVEDGKRLTPASPMGIASMSKPIVAAITLMLDEEGVFGAAGLDTPVDQLLSPEQVDALTIGEDPAHPRCPGTAWLMNRATGGFEHGTFSCPDLSAVNLRHLMVSHHGMYDYLNEVFLVPCCTQFGQSLLYELFTFLGLDPPPPVSSTSGFDYLKAFGLRRNDNAVIGGNLISRDMEVSLGNTGFQLLGVILEERTGKTLDELIRQYIVDPLGIDPIFVDLDPTWRSNIKANGYDVYTGNSLFEDTGVYPLTELHGHSAINTLSFGLGLPANRHTAGGAAGLMANPQSYRVFIDAFVTGELLGPGAWAELVNSFVFLPEASIPGVAEVYNGFSLVWEFYPNFPGLPALSVLSHNGSLPGVLCFNPVLVRHDRDIAPISGAICINSRRLSYPSFNGLVGQFLVTMIFANP